MQDKKTVMASHRRATDSLVINDAVLKVYCLVAVSARNSQRTSPNGSKAHLAGDTD